MSKQLPIPEEMKKRILDALTKDPSSERETPEDLLRKDIEERMNPEGHVVEEHAELITRLKAEGNHEPMSEV